MEPFYCVKMVLPDGSRGYVVNNLYGLNVAIEGSLFGMLLFKTYTETQAFLRETVDESLGAKTYIRDNEDLAKDETVKEGIVSLERNMYCLEMVSGERLCYSHQEQGYCFNKYDFYFCAFYDKYLCLAIQRHFEAKNIKTEIKLLPKFVNDEAMLVQ